MSHPRRSLIATLVAALVCVAVPVAQRNAPPVPPRPPATPAPPAETPTFRVSVRYIEVDAVVLDKQGKFDRAAAAAHFGLAESYLQPPTEGEGESLAHDPAWGSDRDSIAAGRPAPEHRRAEMRKHMRPGFPDEHHSSSTALFGDRRIDSRRVKGD